MPPPATPDSSKKPAEMLRRDLALEASVIKRAEGAEGADAAVRMEFSFSSEQPVERWYGTEILLHKAGAVDFSMMDGGPILTDHNSYNVESILGVAEKCWLDGKKARVRMRWATGDPRADRIRALIEQGVINRVSVGYRVKKWKKEEDLNTGRQKRTALQWMPREISFVALAADSTVGIGRDENQVTPQEDPDMPPKTERDDDNNPTRDDDEKITKARAEARADEQNRIRLILTMSERHDLEELGRKAIEEGTSYADFNKSALTAIGERNDKLRTAQPMADGDVDLKESETRKFSLQRLILAQYFGEGNRTIWENAAFEREVSSAAVQAMPDGFSPAGMIIPDRVLTGMPLRELDGYYQMRRHGQMFQRAPIDTGSGTTGAALVSDNLIAGAFIEYLYNSSALMRAGIYMLPGLMGNIEVPRQAGGASAGEVAEGADAPESLPSFDQVLMSAKHVGIHGGYSRNLMLQSTPAVEMLIRNDFAMAMGLRIDWLGLHGSGTNNQPRGILQTTGVNSVDISSNGQPTYDEMIDMQKAIKEDNAMVGSPQWLFAAAVWAHLATTTKSAADTASNFILGPDGRPAGAPYVESQQLGNNDIVLGVWSQLMCGEWGGLDVITDPYTQSRKGQINITMFKSIDFAVRHPESFCIGA